MAYYSYDNPFLYADDKGTMFPSINAGYGPWENITSADLS